MNQQNFAAMREAMIASQLRTVAVDDPRVIAALKAVPREVYVPDGRTNLAYVDNAIPLGSDRALNLPLATARLITEAKVQPDHLVLLIGAATGYAAAVLGQLAAQVVAVEGVALAATARANLADMPNIVVVSGALNAGDTARGPYDVILIDGAIEQLPDGLLAQLKVGGRLVAGVIERGVTRLASGYKTAGGFRLVPFLDTACVALPGFAKPKEFTF